MLNKLSFLIMIENMKVETIFYVKEKRREKYVVIWPKMASLYLDLKSILNEIIKQI